MTSNLPDILTKREETKRDRFVRLANARLEKALDAIRLLQNLTDNPYNYEYTSQDIRIIKVKLLRAINKLG